MRLSLNSTHRILALFFTVSSLAPSLSQAFDFSLFQNANFEASNPGYCGIHTEVSGSRLIVTNIVPPRFGAIEDCSGWTNCEGQTSIFNCDSAGTCRDEDGNDYYILLEDGNIFNQQHGVKDTYANSDTFHTCTLK